MTAVVLDASVTLEWFDDSGEHRLAATALRAAFEAGRLTVIVPPLIRLEMLNVAGRKWRWDNRRLTAFAAVIGEYAFRFREPDLAEVAKWASRGLTAYDASYVALAEAEGIDLITDDTQICMTAPNVAVPLEAWNTPDFT